MPMHTQIHSCVRVCGCSCFLSMSVFCHRAHTGIFYVIGYWLFTPFVVLKLLISCTWLNARYPFFPPLEYVLAPTCTDTRSRSHTHTHTQTCQQRVEELRELLSTTQTALWLLLLCIAVDFRSVFYEMDSPLITKLRPSRWLLGYAAGSTKALSAACHATGIYKCQTGQRRAARGGSITCRRRCMKLHTELSYDTCLIAKAFGRVDCV